MTAIRPFIAFLALSTLLLAARPANAAYAWLTNASGVTTNGLVSWSAGQTLADPLLHGFGAYVTVTEDWANQRVTFQFSPMNMLAVSHPGGSLSPIASRSDTLSFNLLVQGGKQVDQITVRLDGNYAMDVLNGGTAQVDVNAGLLVTDNQTLATAGGPVSILPTVPSNPPFTFPISLPTPTVLTGLWAGNRTEILNPLWTDLNIQLGSTLSQLVSGAGQADIELTAANIRIDVSLIPEPGSLSLAGLAAVGLLRRRH